MKKIFNWTFGSFFRTIGRVFAFLILGTIFAYFVSKSGLKVPHWLTMKVSAEQIVVPVIPRSNEFYFGIPNWSSGWSLDATNNFVKTSFWAHNYVQEQWLQFSTTSFDNNVDYIEFTFMATEPYTVDLQSNNQARYCSKWELTTWTDTILSGGTHAVVPNLYTCKEYTSYDLADTHDIYNEDLGNFSLYFELENTSGGKPMCTITGTSIICPTNKLQPYKLHIYTYFNTTTNTHFDFNISRHARGYYTQNQQQIIDSINNQTQQQHQDSQNIQNKIDDVNDTINDDDTSEATSSASNLFNNYEDDDFGLSGIITAPLDLIESMISPTCNPIKLTGASGIFEDVDIELPCLTPLYEEFFGDVLDIYQMITFGIISYKIVVDIFRWVRSFKNPDEDRLEVIDL